MTRVLILDRPIVEARYKEALSLVADPSIRGDAKQLYITAALRLRAALKTEDATPSDSPAGGEAA